MLWTNNFSAQHLKRYFKSSEALRSCNRRGEGLCLQRHHGWGSPSYCGSAHAQICRWLLLLRWENQQYLAVSLLQTPQWWPPAGSPCLLLHPVQAAPEVRAWLTWLPPRHFPVLTESPSSITNISHISHLPNSLQSNLRAPLRSPERWDPFLCLFPWLPRSQQSWLALGAHRRQSQARSAFQLFAGVGASLSAPFPPSLSLCSLSLPVPVLF